MAAAWQATYGSPQMRSPGIKPKPGLLRGWPFSLEWSPIGTPDTS